MIKNYYFILDLLHININARKTDSQARAKEKNLKTRTHLRRNRITQRSFQSLRYWSHRKNWPQIIKIRHAKSWILIKKSNHLQHDCWSISWRSRNWLWIIFGWNHIQIRWQIKQSNRFIYIRLESIKYSTSSTTIDQDLWT